MSSFGGGGGSRTRMGMKVCLNVYDLSPANDFLYPIGFGMHHSGVEVMGSEYTFASGAGIFSHQPKVVPGGAIFREQLELGIYEGSVKDLNFIISELRETYGPDDYNLIRKNCNHFANSFTWRLLQRTIPGYVNRLADLGVCCSCLLPRKMLENAPVGGSSSTSSTSASSSSFLVKAPPGRSLTGSTTTSSKTSSFQGTGMKVGGTSSSVSNSYDEEQKSLLSRFSLGPILGTTSSNSSAAGNNSSMNQRQDDLTDRREKARKAALARLEKQKTDQQPMNDNSDKSQ